jgi:hypothetical protein
MDSQHDIEHSITITLTNLSVGDVAAIMMSQIRAGGTSPVHLTGAEPSNIPFLHQTQEYPNFEPYNLTVLAMVEATIARLRSHGLATSELNSWAFGLRTQNLNLFNFTSKGNQR